MNGAPPAAWLDALLQWLQAIQAGLCRSLHALGLTDTVHGQPAWPWPWRIASDTLRIDHGLARQFAITLAMAGTALVMLVLALGWRRRRALMAAAAGLLLLAAPWPSPALILDPANPTSFHVSPAGFDPASIERGARLYPALCAECHGSDGRGEGPRASSLPVWPPDLTGALLWRHPDGEAFWHLAHGMRDRQGGATMPGFDAELDDADLWALLDFLKDRASGPGGSEWAAEGVVCRPPPAPEISGRSASDPITSSRLGLVKR